MKIAIIGGGYVGLHTALRLTEISDDITIFDKDSDKISRFNNGASPISDFYMEDFIKNNPGYLRNISYQLPNENWSEYELIFISLSTNPKKNDARLETKYIFKLVDEIKSKNPDVSIVIRSTINIDDGNWIEKKGVAYWPEFLSQGVETIKNLNQEVSIISIPKDNYYFQVVFEDLFKNKTLIKTNVKEAIASKIMHNTMDAYLISVTNLFANISQENEIDFDTISIAVEKLLQSRPKVKKPGIGYGGSCYPKDSYSLMEITKNEQNQKLVQAMEDFNNEQSFAFLAREDIINSAKKILVLGASFKGGTNDITRTPTVSLREWLFNNNIHYKIWEPMISDSIIFDWEKISDNVKNDINESDLVIVATDWNEFNTLLLNYSGNVIDLKTCIRNNGKMKIYKIGHSN